MTEFMTSRRSFLASTLFASAQPARRPNILFCISDDQSWLHASAYGSRFIKTPAFDRLAREGALFDNAFVSTPSCGPSRGAALTGQDFYRLGPASMNHTEWQRGAETYPDLLARAGYHTGYTGKAWGPGNWKVSGRSHNPAGPEYNDMKLNPPGPGISNIDYAANFAAFLERRPANSPFCFWAGFLEPHRVFDEGIGARHGIKPTQSDVPAFFPDAPEVRTDLADYAFEIQHLDSHLDRILQLLQQKGELENTLIFCTSDNGFAFPRAKGNMYEYGVHMPLAIRWGAKCKPGRKIADFVSFPDFAPTILEAAGLPISPTMTGRSLLPLLTSTKSGQIDPARDHAVFGIERHFPGSRPEGAGYPVRAIRTKDYLFIWNLHPERNPVGDRPGPVWPDDDPTQGFGDTDGGPTKTYIWNRRAHQPSYAELAFGKRAAEELYLTADGPANLTNRAANPQYNKIKNVLRAKLKDHLTRTADPRATGRGAELDAVMRKYPSISPETSRREAMKK
jgi:N-sulfoglucosamine sulfohydrolase